MGTDFGDYDGDGKLDLFVTNIELEPNNLYHNNGDETFTDVTVQAHLGGGWRDFPAGLAHGL